MSTCEHRETAASYVLGALPADENERFVAHLSECDECRASVATLQVAADALPLATVQMAPPPELKDRIMTVVRTEGELRGAAETRTDEPVPPAPRRRRWWRGPFLGLGPLPAAAATALVIAVVVAGGLTLLGGDDTRTVQGEVLIASAPSARAAVELSDDATKLTVSDMPPPPAGKVYQVWLKRPAQDPEPTTALFRVDARGHADVQIQRGRLKGIEQVLVTAEPDGGSMAPTSDPVVAARVA
jgi:anti-sigma-K factor RskA